MATSSCHNWGLGFRVPKLPLRLEGFGYGDQPTYASVKRNFTGISFTQRHG